MPASVPSSSATDPASTLAGAPVVVGRAGQLVISSEVALTEVEVRWLAGIAAQVGARAVYISAKRKIRMLDRRGNGLRVRPNAGGASVEFTHL